MWNICVIWSRSSSSSNSIDRLALRLESMCQAHIICRSIIVTFTEVRLLAKLLRKSFFWIQFDHLGHLLMSFFFLFWKLLGKCFQWVALNHGQTHWKPSVESVSWAANPLPNTLSLCVFGWRRRTPRIKFILDGPSLQVRNQTTNTHTYNLFTIIIFTWIWWFLLLSVLTFCLLFRMYLLKLYGSNIFWQIW